MKLEDFKKRVLELKGVFARKPELKSQDNPKFHRFDTNGHRLAIGIDLASEPDAGAISTFVFSSPASLTFVVKKDKGPSEHARSIGPGPSLGFHVGEMAPVKAHVVGGRDITPAMLEMAASWGISYSELVRIAKTLGVVETSVEKLVDSVKHSLDAIAKAMKVARDAIPELDDMSSLFDCYPPPKSVWIPCLGAIRASLGHVRRTWRRFFGRGTRRHPNTLESDICVEWP